jgi:hypothetical protein
MSRDVDEIAQYAAKMHWKVTESWRFEKHQKAQTIYS